MSRLDKLQIMGIRSFSPSHGNVIQFYTPLTLIVGSNGSGKTTIIECLKYATTGLQPPNHNGGNFIHDPKLSGDKEVLAQVKLSFVNSEGLVCVATRSMQLTVKKTSRTVKSLESSVKWRRGGEASTISSRVSEMDTLMPRYLGVSRAVLDSVIFCHQEESLWPMMAPKFLKEKFDEIFEAQKYTMAVERIRIMQKNKRVELGQLEIHETTSRVNKERGKKMKETMERLQDENDELRKQNEEFGGKVKEYAGLAEDAWQKMGAAELIVGQLQGKRVARDTKQESVQSLRDNLHELSDSDEHLQRMLEQFDERVRSSEAEISEYQSREAELQDSVRTARERVGVKERECGFFEAQKESYDRTIVKRQRLVKETARMHSIRGFDHDVDDAQARAFMDRISKMAREQSAAFERARQETAEELQQAQATLNQISEQKSALNQSKDSARMAMTANDSKMGNLQAKLDRISNDEGTRATLESKVRDVQTRLQNAKADEERTSSAGQIDSLETELRKLEDQKETLDNELVEATRTAGETAQLDIRQKELKDSRRGLETMTAAHGDTIGAIIGPDWTPETLENDFQRVLSDRVSAVSNAERQRDGTVQEQGQVKFKLKQCRLDLTTKQNVLKAAQKAIKDAVDCEPQDYHEEVENLERSRDVLKADQDSFKMINDYFALCVKTAKEHKACKTCMRGLKDKDIDTLVRNVERERQKLRASDDDESALAEIEENLKTARGVSSDFDTWERLREKELPALQSEEKTLLEQESRLSSRVEELDAAVRDKHAAKRDVDAIARNVQKIANYSLDINRIETEIQDLAKRHSAAGLSRGLELIQDESKKLTEDIRTSKAQLTRLLTERDRYHKQTNSLELEVRDVKNQLNTVEYQLKEKTSLEGQVDEYKTLNSEQRSNIKSIDAKLSDLVPKQSAAQEKYDDIHRRGQEKDRELQAAASSLNNSVNELQLVEQNIRAYLDKGGDQQLIDGKREVESLKADVARFERECNQAMQQVKQMEEQLRDQSEQKRSIADNQRYRRDLRQLKTIETEIRELEKHNAEEEKTYWENQVAKYQDLRNHYAGEQATVAGQYKSKDDQLVRLIEDYKTDGEGATREYRKAHILVETTRAAIEDLGRYGAALDKAIMQYHSLKMEEINRIIGELWRSTYQGNDVETILIRSESDVVRSNKNYNYRVCMVRADVEMDMRGRCSAGQKVLACIIIRLALAECFGVNCGMIALDEPTTNLDTENIQALAKSLGEIIRQRRGQSNFQLIVITHDEDFLRHMNCSDFVDHYWRVSRGDDMKSVIERNTIANVMR